ncbi:MAG TPA: hypothetical protein DD738_08335 [Ruminiclostridium sp.]|nr:hypothetical protein [Ruminiclostridium sp.]
MEELIKKIIEIEHEAQSLVDDGIAQKEKIRMDTENELKAIEENILDMAERKIEQLEVRNRKEADEKLARIREHTALKVKQINGVIAGHKEMWENQIFSRITGRRTDAQ